MDLITQVTTFLGAQLQAEAQVAEVVLEPDSVVAGVVVGMVLVMWEVVVEMDEVVEAEMEEAEQVAAKSIVPLPESGWYGVFAGDAQGNHKGVARAGRAHVRHRVRGLAEHAAPRGGRASHGGDGVL